MSSLVPLKKIIKNDTYMRLHANSMAIFMTFYHVVNRS